MRGAAPSVAGRALFDGYAAARPPRGTYTLYGGYPDLSLVPRAAIARAYRRALLARGGDALGYGDPRGEPALREGLAAMLRSLRGLSVDADRLVVTRGSQMALDLSARAILAPGDVVAVESWGYRPAWEALALAGAQLRPLPVDRDGLDVAALAELCAREPVRAVYVTPHHQYPTTVTLSAARRIALLDLARRERLAIFEDDYDHEFHYEGRPVLPLASADAAGSVIYLGTLSKILAPALRVGFVAATPDVVRRVAELRTFGDRQGDTVLERALAELLDDGEVQRHARRMRRIYRERRDVLVGALREHLGDAVRFAVPNGGIALWCRAADGADVDAWAARAGRAGVRVQTAKRFAFDGRARPFLRLGFAPHDPRGLREAIRRLAGCAA
jgi:GntR family transcriptional regulator/MocR family aminotransferase